MREQHVGLQGRVAPDVGMDRDAVDAEVFLARAQRRRRVRPRPAGGERRGEQSCRPGRDRIRGDAAAEQECQPYQLQSSR